MSPLSNTDLKSTGQRAVILDIVKAGKGHLDADEIYQRARINYPGCPCRRFIGRCLNSKKPALSRSGTSMKITTTTKYLTAASTIT